MSVYLTDVRRSGISLLLATGSRRHLEKLEQRASARGMVLTPEGLRQGRKIVAARSEAEIYEGLDLQYIEPELREGLDEVERAEARAIPSLVSAEDLRGVAAAARLSTLCFYDFGFQARDKGYDFITFRLHHCKRV